MEDTAQQPPITPLNSQQQGGVGFAKETEPVIEKTIPEIPSLTEIGRNIELTPEVSAAGVSVHPTVVAMPQPIEASGVKQAGQNVSLGSGETIELPLTDDQIVVGLRQPATSSWKFLAEWCRKRLKQIGLAIKIIGGKAVEVET